MVEHGELSATLASVVGHVKQNGAVAAAMTIVVGNADSAHWSLAAVLAKKLRNECGQK